ncbi:MAG: TetR/AcrR family transcriptional regulator [Desulfobacterales bacterium]|nr:TetR/AcrR family transcriptional regulator [Desulfobacterales bacterium]
MGRKSISHIRKPEILRHTYKVVEEEGFKGMTIGKIAKRMGVNSGLLIHYFKSKEGLIMEMVDFLYDSSMNHYINELESLTTPKERLESLLDILFDTSGTRPQRDAVFWSCYAMGFRDEQIREKIKAMMLRFIEFGVEEILGWEETGLAKVEDKKKAAAKILALSEGFGILKNSVDDPEIVQEVAEFMKNTTLETLNCKSLLE